MAYLAGTVLFVIGCVCGLDFPDLDQQYGMKSVLVHRSILTHNALLPLLLLAVGWRFLFRYPFSVAGRLFLIGLSFATAMHSCFDMFPRDWRGFALIHIPFDGRTSPVFSWCWLLITVLVCLIIGCWLIRSMGEFIISLLGLGTLYGQGAIQEPKDALYVLLLVLLISFFAFVLSRHRNDPDDPASRIRRFLREP